MKHDFEFQGTRYVLDFDDLDAKEIGGVCIRTFNNYGDSKSECWALTIREIKDNAIVWESIDIYYVPKEAQDYCNRIIKNKVFL